MTRRGNGWLPTKERLFAQALFQGSLAYKKAKVNASKGYDPGMAAHHAQTYSLSALAFWMYVPMGSFVSLLIFPVSILWNVPLGLVLFRRYRTFAASPPDKRLRYGVPTGLLITLYTIGLFVSGIGWLVTLANAPVPGVK